MINKLNDDVSVIGKLSDRPTADDGMTSSQLKAQFDRAPEIIKTYINETLVPSINASEIPSEEIEGLSGSTVREQIVSLLSMIQNI